MTLGSGRALKTKYKHFHVSVFAYSPFFGTSGVTVRSELSSESAARQEPPLAGVRSRASFAAVAAVSAACHSPRLKAAPSGLKPPTQFISE